jgi:hypothetical protein
MLQTLTSMVESQALNSDIPKGLRQDEKALMRLLHSQ